MKTPIRVELLGRTYTLRVEESEEERTRAVARQVDRRMHAFQRQHPDQAKLTTAVITALALAEDLRLEREAHREHGDALRNLTDTLTDALAAGDASDRDASAGETSPAPSEFA